MMNVHLALLLWIQIVFYCSEIIHCCYLPYAVGKPIGICEYLSHSVVPREGWGAKDPTGPLECFWDPIDLIILHHTATPRCTTPDACQKAVKELQDTHMKDKMWLDIGYHFIIGGDGNVYEGRPWYKVGAHTKYHNKVSIGIALIGDYDKDCPDPTMLDLIPKIIFCGVEKGYIDPDFYVIGHRDAYCTNCPGDAFYKVIRTWPRFPTIVPIHTYTCDANETTTAMPTTTTAEPTTTTTAPTTTTAAPTTTTPEPTTTTVKPTTEVPSTTDKAKYFYFVVPYKQKTPWYYQPWQANWWK